MNRPSASASVLVHAAIAVTALPHLDDAPLDAQSPPRPPHLYYGDGGADSAAQIDGAPRGHHYSEGTNFIDSELTQ